jgi:hypothetical protein
VGKAIWTAGVAIAAGIAVGFAMVLQRREVACADGTLLPEGEADVRCFAHPHALVGTAVLAAFVGLGAVLYLAWVIVTAVDARSQPSN